MTTITITRPPTVQTPRGAIWAAQAAAAMLDLFERLHQRHAVEKAALDRADEAAAVRRLADGWIDIDHRFAADLYAAAARHERDTNP